jgi:hypothetical protein
MNPQEFETYVSQPTLLRKETIPDLEQLVKDFPYFQAAHMLLTLAGKKHDARIYQQSLRKTAIVSTSRSQLFHLVQSLEKQIETEKQVQNVPAIEVPVQAKAPVIEEQLEEKELPQQELNILKAAELSTDESNSISVELPEKISATEQAEINLENEIGKQVVTAFVEKEILKTPDAHKVDEKPEPESFGDWLSYLKKNNGQAYSEISGEVNKAKAKKEREQSPDYLPTEPAPDNRRQKNKAIIDKIIEKNPGLIRNREEQKFYTPDLKAKESLLENEHLVTETLARIYALQGSVNKAIRAYEILSLKYPQKSAYFASLIQKLKHN